MSLDIEGSLEHFENLVIKNSFRYNSRSDKDLVLSSGSRLDKRRDQVSKGGCIFPNKRKG